MKCTKGLFICGEHETLTSCPPPTKAGTLYTLPLSGHSYPGQLPSVYKLESAIDIFVPSVSHSHFFEGKTDLHPRITANIDLV